jgi:FtsZ-binding cell division protein ZapB
MSPGSFDGLKTPRVIRRRGGSETPNSREESESDENEPAEMTALKLELSTLATSHASLQSSMQLLQAQLLDLQRVNASLQDENEAWGVLVQQRTLAGTFDISGLGPTKQDTAESPNNSGAEDDVGSIKSMRSGLSAGRGTLDRVSELDELAYEANQHDKETELDPELDLDASARQTKSLASELDPSVIGEEKAASGRSRRRGMTDGTSSPAGESLANLPITGPGLDLAAELGRAENNGGFVLGEPPKPARKKSRQDEGKATEGTKSEVEALRVEVKALKDTNKALSLYASKIIDRIITMEGFEGVLAVDFQAPPPTPGPASGVGKFISAITGGGSGSKKSSARPTSFLFGGKAMAPPPPPQEKLTTFETFRLDKSQSQPAPTPAPVPVPVPALAPTPEPANADDRRSRRSMSFDFRGLFGTSASQTEAEKRANDPLLKPLTLRPGSTSLNPNALLTNLGAKKLETTEDDEDRKERERLRATMRLMGIEPAQPAAPPIIHSQSEPPLQKTNLEPPLSPLPSFSTGGKVVFVGAPPPSVPPTPSKWNFFRRNTDNAPGSSTPPTSLTTEALEQAEAESHIAALDAREKVIKDEIAKGSGSGFTEISGLRGGDGRTRRSLGEEWRSRRSSTSLPSLGGTEGLKGLGVRPSPSHSQGPDSDAGSISQASLLFNAEDVHDD